MKQLKQWWLQCIATAPCVLRSIPFCSLQLLYTTPPLWYRAAEKTLLLRQAAQECVVAQWLQPVCVFGLKHSTLRETAMCML
jgi:hypothetical protein